MVKRIAFLLTLDISLPRAVFSKEILQKIGFTVQPIHVIPNKDRILSNKISMQYIYSLIAEGDDTYAYVFEDDINVLEDIELEEVIEYEKISDLFFYLGICEPPPESMYGSTYGLEKSEIILNNNLVYKRKGNVHGLHAIGISKEGARRLLDFSKHSTRQYMDMIVSDFSEKYPAAIVRYDLESYTKGHRGVIFQDRTNFPSTIS